jgi:hypothetical protein
MEEFYQLCLWKNLTVIFSWLAIYWNQQELIKTINIFANNDGIKLLNSEASLSDIMDRINYLQNLKGVEQDAKI